MTDLIMQLGGVIQREMDTLRDVSQNIANANTPGYRATRAFSAFTETMPSLNVSLGLSSIENRAVIKTDGGALHLTGRATDLAISGDAWFVLQTPQGQQLSRDGRFRVDGAGQLVNQAGYPLLGLSGPLIVGPGVLTVDVTGEVSVDGQAQGMLKVVRVADSKTIVASGGGLYATTVPLLFTDRYVIHQGMQERSNADLSTDMVKIMEVSRHVESVQRALSAYDGMLNSGINQLGKE